MPPSRRSFPARDHRPETRYRWSLYTTTWSPERSSREPSTSSWRRCRSRSNTTTHIHIHQSVIQTREPSIEVAPTILATLLADREVRCGDEVSLSTPGRSIGRRCGPFPKNFYDFWARQGEFWCILGLITPTSDRPSVSNFWPPARLGGDRPRRPRGFAPALYVICTTVRQHLKLQGVARFSRR